jgi:hypothetical protein
VHWQHPQIVTWEKRKRKETNKKKLQQAIESQRKAKKKITWRWQVSNPLGKGNGSTHPRQIYAQEKSTNHQTKNSKTMMSSPAHMQDPPEPMQLPLDECMQTTSWNRAATSAQLSLVRPVDKIAQHLGITPVRPGPLTGPADATWETARAQKSLETTWKPSKCVQQAISSSNFSPLLTMHESSQKCQKFNQELLK